MNKRILKKELLKLLSDDLVAINSINSLECFLDNVTTKLQDSGPGDIVFYKVKDEEKERELFKKRLQSGAPGLVILNYGAQSFIKNENCVFIDSDFFLNIQKKILDFFYPDEKKMKLIGVTGTNGKTTTVNLAMQISSFLNHAAISVGTIGVLDKTGVLQDDLEATTPSYICLRKLIYKYQNKYEACFLEISSHALAQNRLHDLRLDGAGWTSFSQDHLDYHKDMDRYFSAKLLIETVFLKENNFLVVPKFETELCSKILKSNPNVRMKIARTLEERKIFTKPLFYHSTYNQSNVEVALQLNANLWGEKKLDNLDLEKIATPKGRFSIIKLKNESMAIVDYAHTPDALANIGRAIKKAFPEHSVTVIFGCGGNRDKQKRPLMGKAVSLFANKIIVTSDNPRDEAAEDIIGDIVLGVEKNYEVFVDRKKAILHAMESMKEKEIILIAGKGHEEYQEIKGTKEPFSDFAEVFRFIEEGQNK